MTELQLYKFIKETESEIDWRNKELVVWIYHGFIDGFSKLVNDDFSENGGIDCKLQQNYIALDLVPLCNYYGINPENIKNKT